MDLIGKLTKTKDGNQYLCVMIDYFTKWPQAYPLKTKSATEVTNCILKFVYQFESPKRILTDQGREFVNAVSSSVLVKTFLLFLHELKISLLIIKVKEIIMFKFT